MTFTALDPANLESILTSFGQAPFNLEIKTTGNHTYDLPTFAPLTDNVMNIAHTSDSTGTMVVAGVTVLVGSMVSFMFSHQTQAWYSLSVPAAGGAIWGDITGTLSNQTDLQTALNAKAPTASPTFTMGITTPEITGNGSPTIIKPSVDAASGVSSISIKNAAGSVTVLGIETANGRLGVLTSTPNQPLDVNGNARIDGQLVMGAASPNAHCLIDMINPFAGLGLPIMTTAQKDALTPHRQGNFVFDTDLTAVSFDTGTAWVDMDGSPTPPAGSDGQVQFNASGSFGASTSLAWDNTQAALSLTQTGPSSQTPSIDLNYNDGSQAISLAVQPVGGSDSTTTLTTGTPGVSTPFTTSDFKLSTFGAGAVQHTWNFNFDGTLAVPGNIINMPDPVNPQDAATKAYVDVKSIVLGVTSVDQAASEALTGTGAFVASGTYTITLTPASASSRFILEAFGSFSGSGPTNPTQIALLSGSTDLLAGGGPSSSNDPSSPTPLTLSTVDAPNTTSPITYSIGTKITAASTGVLGPTWTTFRVTELAS